MSRDKREAERAARRARRLAERAEERAKRKERHAERATERAERLAERVRRRPSRERELDQSIEDLVDEVTEKAEAWIDEQTKKLFETSASDDRQVRKAESQARKAREEADKARASAKRAEVAADELSEFEASMDEDNYGAHYDDDYLDDGGDGYYDDSDDGLTSKQRRKAKRKAQRRARRQRYGYGSWHRMDWGYDDWGMGMSSRRRRRRRSANLYRDRQNKKICGVCAGLGDYFGRPAWEMRLYAILGMIFIPSVTFPAYFIMYFLMDDKPYYRRVTDRFEEKVDRKRQSVDDVVVNEEDSVKRRSRAEPEPPRMNNVQAMNEAKGKFADIEQRLRQMETHVTSSQFELHREFKKISGED